MGKIYRNKTYIIKGFLTSILFIAIGGIFNFISSNIIGYDFDGSTNFMWKFIVWSADVFVSMCISFIVFKFFKSSNNRWYDKQTIFLAFTFLSIFHLVCSSSDEFSRFAIFIALFFALYSGYSELD